jgi:hypothetical protein
MYGFPRKPQPRPTGWRMGAVLSSYAPGCVGWFSARRGVATSGGVVVRWNNLVRGGVHLAPGSSSNPAFVTQAIGDAYPVVRYGAGTQYLAFSASVTNIRTVIVVAKDSGSRPLADIVGGTPGSGMSALHGGDWSLISPFWATAAYSVFYNGVAQPAEGSRPSSYTVISIVSLNSMTFSALGINQYDSFNRYWVGDYAEILLYTAELSVAERSAIEYRLMHTYKIA